jgi:hypothetical protein
MAGPMNRKVEGMCTLSRLNRGPMVEKNNEKSQEGRRLIEFRTEHLLNTSLERYSYNKLLRKSPRQEAGTRAIGYVITWLLCNPNLHLHVNKNLPLNPTVRKSTPRHLSSLASDACGYHSSVHVKVNSL